MILAAIAALAATPALAGDALAGDRPLADQSLPVAAADAASVTGATLYHPEFSAVKSRLPVIVTGILGNCTTLTNPATARSSATALHIPVASKGFLVVGVGVAQEGAAPYVIQHDLAPWRAALAAVLALNDDRSSPYYRRIDTKRIGTWGISCGGVLAFELAQVDRRVATVFGWSTSTNQRATPQSSAAMLARIAPRPVAWFIGGPSDVPYANTLTDWAAVPANMPAFLARHATYDHIQMGGNVDKAALVNWFDHVFYKRKSAAAYFLARPFGACRGTASCDWQTETRNWSTSQTK
jgi:hypothetical protein